MQLDATRIKLERAADAQAQLTDLDAKVQALAALPDVKGCVSVGKLSAPIVPTRSSTQPLPLPKPLQEHEQGGKLPEPIIPQGAERSKPGGPEIEINPIQRFPVLAMHVPNPPSYDPLDPSAQVYARTDLVPVNPGFPEENQAASGHHVVIYTGNADALYSTNDGHTFTHLNPSTVFGAIDGGFCCDQVVRYARTVNRFLWLLQGNCASSGCVPPALNRYRLAVASPESISAAAAAGQPVEGVWSMYDLTPALIGDRTWYDYPDLAVSDRALYLIWNRVSVGSEMARMSLAQLAAGGNASFFHWEATAATFGRAVQNPGATGYFVTNDAVDATLADAFFSNGDSPLLFSTSMNHSAIPTTDFSSDTGFASPGPPPVAGDDWANRCINRCGTIQGATLGGAGRDQLWLAWTAGRRFSTDTMNTWSQPHVHYDGYRLTDFSRITEAQLFNSNYAIEFPFLNADAAGNVGISFAYGGPTTSNRPAAGILVPIDRTEAPSYFDVGVGDRIDPSTIPAGIYLNRTQGDYTTIQPDGDNPWVFVTGGPFDRYDTVGGMRIPRDHWSFARFGIGETLPAPRVRIISPVDGSTLPPSAAQAFHGSAVDWSNASIDDPSQLQWTVDGTPFGNGVTATLSAAAAGIHTILLTAVDAAGRLGSASIRVQILGADAGGSPSITIDSPTDGHSYPSGDTVAIPFGAHGTDSTGAALPASAVRWSDSYTDVHGITQTVDLGTGLTLNHTLYTSGLSPTTHTITVTATDPANHRTATDHVQISVGAYP
jgi:hypothetical protein